MDNIEKIDDLHETFHNLLGRVTKIRTALWELEHADTQDPQILQVANTESEQLVTDIDSLKSQVYSLLNPTHGQNSHR